MIVVLAIALGMSLSSCGGGGGGASSTARVSTAPGSGKVAASVLLSGRASGRAVAQSQSTSVNVVITVEGVYIVDDTEFPTIATTATISLDQGAAQISLLNVPIGVNHLLTAEANWGAAVETVMAIIPEVTEGAVVTVTVDQASTALANAAIHYVEENNTRLADLDADLLDQWAAAVTALHNANVPYSDMTPGMIINYALGAGTPAGVVLTPADVSVTLGGTFQFFMAVVDANGVPVAGATPTLALDPAALGAVDAAGLFTASQAGAGVLTASYDAFSATASITVAAMCASAVDCDDGNALTIDDCANAGTASAACTNTAVACALNADCDDTNPLTIDTCTNAGTVSAVCSNASFACNIDTDCDDANPGTTDTCTNPGTTSAVCTTTVNVGEVSVGIQSLLCSLNGDGTVDCWGQNPSGLGDGSSTQSSVPVPVSGITTAVGISVGYESACAVLSSGAVQCWGDNTNGTLGDGTNTSSNVPVSVSGISTATAIAAGAGHTCALLSSGAVKCWGDNSAGQLGDGTNTNSTTPVPVSGISTATTINGGYSHTCVILLIQLSSSIVQTHMIS